MAYNRSTDGGRTWEPAQLLIEDTDPRFLNDKNSMTADPNDADYVYAVWDRLQNANADTKLGPAENRVGLGLQGPDLLHPHDQRRRLLGAGAQDLGVGRQQAGARRPDRGAARQPRRRRARLLHRVSQRLQSRRSLPALAVVHPLDRQGRLVGQGGARRHRVPGSILVGRDGDSTIDVEPVPCPDPTETGSCPIRSGDFIPDVAVDPRNGNLYAVWMDLRFDGGIFLTDHDNIAFTMSTDGGRTWSPTIKVNQTPDHRAQLRPAGVHARRSTWRPTGRSPSPTTTSATTPPARRRSTPTTSPCTATPAAPARASWAGNETRITPTSFDIRKAPVRARLLPRRLHGPRVSRYRLPSPCSARRSCRTTPTNT